MAHKILLVDDDGEHLRFLQGILEREQFSVLAVSAPKDAVETAAKSRPDLVLSDVAMPGLSGLTLCRRLKADPRTAAIPVILMSGAKKEPLEQATGIEEGADDYVTKPFAPRLLLARIRAVLKRYRAAEEPESVLRTEGLTLDVKKRTVSVRGREVPMTRKEFDLLATLMRNGGRVVGAPALLEQIWGYDTADYNNPHTVESHVYSLRRKLGARIAQKIVNVSGVGYRFEI